MSSRFEAIGNPLSEDLTDNVFALMDSFQQEAHYIQRRRSKVVPVRIFNLLHDSYIALYQKLVSEVPLRPNDPFTQSVKRTLWPPLENNADEWEDVKEEDVSVEFEEAEESTGGDEESLKEDIEYARQFIISQCWNCQGYGHNGSECKELVRCAICGGFHRTKICNDTWIECVLCLEHHPAGSDSCPLYTAERRRIRRNMLAELEESPEMAGFRNTQHHQTQQSLVTRKTTENITSVASVIHGYTAATPFSNTGQTQALQTRGSRTSHGGPPVSPNSSRPFESLLTRTLQPIPNPPATADTARVGNLLSLAKRKSDDMSHDAVPVTGGSVQEITQRKIRVTENGRALELWVRFDTTDCIVKRGGRTKILLNEESMHFAELWKQCNIDVC